jgi:hypothetical protein
MIIIITVMTNMYTYIFKKTRRKEEGGRKYIIIIIRKTKN